MSTEHGLFSSSYVRARARASLIQGNSAEILARISDNGVGDFTLNAGAGPKQELSMREAAVLVPILEGALEARVLLTRRSDALPTHPGQISFPGGKIDDSDKDPRETALRETREEVGLAERFVDVVGYLDPYETGTGYRILPVVAIVSPGHSLRREPGEVADIFDVPLRFLMSPENHEIQARTFSGVERHFHAMPYQGRNIWGATAGILKNLYDRMYGG